MIPFLPQAEEKADKGNDAEYYGYSSHNTPVSLSEIKRCASVMIFMEQNELCVFCSVFFLFYSIFYLEFSYKNASNKENIQKYQAHTFSPFHTAGFLMADSNIRNCFTVNPLLCKTFAFFFQLLYLFLFPCPFRFTAAFFKGSPFTDFPLVVFLFILSSCFHGGQEKCCFACPYFVLARLNKRRKADTAEYSASENCRSSH